MPIAISADFWARLGTVFGILLIVVFFGFILWVLWWQSRLVPNAEKEQKALLQTAIPGEAKIIEIIKSEESKSWTDVALRLEVTPQAGESFNAITVWAVPAIHLPEIQPGKSVPVKIVEVHKSKTKNFKSIVPGGSWAELYYWDTEITEENVKTLL